MTDYVKVTDFTSKDDTNALIKGVDFDNEYGAVQSASATKADKAVPAVADSVAMLDSAGNLEDSTVTMAELEAGLAAAISTGMLIPYGGTSAPSGYLLCDGTSYTVASKGDLYAVIGYKFGGSGANFNVPDMRGRAAVGIDDMGGSSANRVTDSSADTEGGAMGAETHALTSGQNAAHTHTGTTSTGGAHTHSGGTSGSGNQGGGGSAAQNIVSTGSAGSHNHTFTTASSGSGTAHNNMQPSLFMTWLIKE